jgi:Thioredoxin like C-terminal domain
VIQALLRDAGHDGVPDDLVSVDPVGFEVQADWSTLESPETYLGYEQAQNFASSDGAKFDEPFTFAVPDQLRRNQWALSGEWTIRPGLSVLNADEGRLAFRFHARDVHLVMGPPSRGASVPFVVTIDGDAPGDAHGGDVDENGNGVLTQQRLHQLVRQPGRIEDRTFEITFRAPGAETYCFTFG